MGGGNSKTTTEKSSVGPWQPQQGYLEGLFKSGQTIYDSLDAKGPYKGDIIAAPTAEQYNQAKQGTNFVNNGGWDAIRSMLAGGKGATDSAMPGINNITSNLASIFASPESSVANLISGANQIRSGFDIPGAVDAALSDARRTAANETLPSLYRQAAATGNINSDRSAIAEGVVKEGLGRKAADISAELNNSIFSKGLDTTLADRNSQISSLDSLRQLLATGQAGTQAGIGAAGDLYNLGQKAADKVQSLEQSKLDNAIQKFYEPDRFYRDKLSWLKDIVGGNYGEEGVRTSKTKENPSALSTAGSILGGIGGLIKK